MLFSGEDKFPLFSLAGQIMNLACPVSWVCPAANGKCKDLQTLCRLDPCFGILDICIDTL